MATPQRPAGARRYLGVVGLVLVAVALLAGCSTRVAGTPLPASPDPVPTGSSSSRFQPGDLQPGDCLTAAGFRVVECAEPHELEVFRLAGLPADLPPGYPTPDILLPRLEPQCRAALPPYVGSSDVDASRLREFVYWPSRQSWNAGQRWALCAVVEIGPDEKPLRRTGALRGVLRDGLGALQACSKDSPSQGALRVVPCTEPHRGEAVPGVLTLGAPTDPPVPAEQANTVAEPHCKQAIDEFLGAPADLLGLRYSWRYPLPQSWPNGYNTVVCYAETATPVTGSLRDP